MTTIARIRPSRRYMIEQAVLNAAANEWAWLGKPELLQRRLSLTTYDATVLPCWLEAAVCREFHKLSERWAA